MSKQWILSAVIIGILLAVVGAVAGTVKSGLNAIVAGARAQMMKAIPKYEYGGVVPETGLALVHKGERIYNPSKGTGTSGGITFNYYHNGPVRNKQDIIDALEEYEAHLFSRRLARSLG